MGQPRRVEFSTVAKCSKCGKQVYVETIVEIEGKTVERIVTGTFRQSLDENGVPNGPETPFCNCGEK